MDAYTPPPYRPIDCGRYSAYEVAILHHQRLRLAWLSVEGHHHIDVVRPRDLQTRRSEEFLIAHTSEGETLTVRLDRITACETL